MFSTLFNPINDMLYYRRTTMVAFLFTTLHSTVSLSFVRLSSSTCKTGINLMSAKVSMHQNGRILKVLHLYILVLSINTLSPRRRFSMRKNGKGRLKSNCDHAKRSPSPARPWLLPPSQITCSCRRQYKLPRRSRGDCTSCSGEIRAF